MVSYPSAALSVGAYAGAVNGAPSRSKASNRNRTLSESLPFLTNDQRELGAGSEAGWSCAATGSGLIQQEIALRNKAEIAGTRFHVMMAWPCGAQANAPSPKNESSPQADTRRNCEEQRFPIQFHPCRLSYLKNPRSARVVLVPRRTQRKLLRPEPEISSLQGASCSLPIWPALSPAVVMD